MKSNIHIKIQRYRHIKIQKVCKKSKVRVVSTVSLQEGCICLTGNFLEKFSFIRVDPPRFDRFDRAGLKKKRGSGGVGLPEPGRDKGVTRRRRGFFYGKVIITAIYVYISISLYVYMNIFVYVYISNYYQTAMSIEQTPSDLFNPSGAALRTIFRHP